MSGRRLWISRTRPDSYYGLSKAYGELAALYYYDRYKIESVSLRIGSCFEAPTNERMLATWPSYGDLARLFIRSVETEKTGYAVVWGVSDNAVGWWGKDDREILGSAGEFDPPGSSIADRFQGGGFCEMLGSGRTGP